MQAYLIPLVQRLIDEAWYGAGVQVVFTSGYRSIERQRRLYARYLASGKKGYPVAPPGRSYHNYGLALDFTTRPAGPAYLATVGRIAEAIGFRWGGRFNDPIHIDTGGPYSEPG